MDRLKATLDDLLQAEVIAQVWTNTVGNSLVLTEKKDKKKLQVCLDSSDLNKATVKQHYSIPTADEVFLQTCW